MATTIPERYGLDERESRFTLSFCAGVPQTAAAIKAGYPEASAAASAYDLLRRPHVLSAIAADARRLLVSEATASIRTLIWLRDHAKSEKVQADCSRSLLDRAGFIAPRAIAEKAQELSLHEMAIGELRDLATKLEGEMATRATPISATVAPAPIQAVDTLA